MSTASDYVLGTHQVEITRLGLQHQVWRPYVLDAWSRAGMSRGSKVVDFGGPPAVRYESAAAKQMTPRTMHSAPATRLHPMRSLSSRLPK